MVTSPLPKDKAEQAGKGKSEERKAQLEAYRAAQTAKKVASVAQKVQPPSTGPTKHLKSRIPSSLKSEQKDPNARPLVKKAVSVSPERKATSSSKLEPQTARPKSGPAAKSKPTSLPPKALSRAAKAAQKQKEPSEPEAKHSAWMEAQHAFGCETARQPESRRTTEGGEPSPTALGLGFGDDGDPNSGIRWQIQMEKLRLQQWRILNARLNAAKESQFKQSEMQLRGAAEAVVAVKEQVARRQLEQAKARNAQHAADALAAQMPRLELYASMQEAHEATMAKISEAVAASLQQMPLINGAVCGSSAEVADEQQMGEALQQIRDALQKMAPQMKPFLGKGGDEGLHGTAKAADGILGADKELHDYLQNNSELLRRVEGELVSAESLAAQLLLIKAGK